MLNSDSVDAKPRIETKVFGPGRLRVLLLLGVLTSTIAFVDRSVLTIMAEPVKKALAFSDVELGLLTGFAFALFTSLAGLPLARFIDRPSTRRPLVVGLCVTLWSAMTMASGIVTSYIQLLAARVLVGAGEAGAGPVITTLMDDTMPRAMRTRAFAIYSLGIPIGTMIGLTFGGLLLDLVGWRWTFVAVGAPGLLLALALLLFLPEPRSVGAQIRSATAPQPSIAESFAIMVRSKALVWLLAAASMGGLVGQGLQSWNGVYLLRVMHLSHSKAGLLLGLMSGLAGGLGTYFGGVIADRISTMHPGRALLVPAFGLLIGLPAAIIAYSSQDWRVFAGVYWITILGSATYIGPMLSVLQQLVPVNYRATAVVVALMLINLMGSGVGSVVIGAASDYLKPQFGADSLRWIMIAMQLTAFIPALCYVRASRFTIARPGEANTSELLSEGHEVGGAIP